ncbi:MAG: hypothetical protein C5B54_01705 [Acidobacteria bacterium]|nr:MAG: hypothetical protein C5B54_01705 [Acidobacteriota bacterium]
MPSSMSYTLFLLLNVNHDKDDVLEHVGQRLEKTGDKSFCFDSSPDIFFTAEYLEEKEDRSICVDIPFGAEDAVIKEVFDFITYLETRVQVQVLDPQVGRTLKPSDGEEVFRKWQNLNLQALRNYSDGHYFLRNVDEKDGKKRMVEAIKFHEETWQNHCSVALAYARIGYAGHAQKHFERALAMDPANSGIKHALGVTLFNLKEYAKAKELLSQALAEDPSNESASQLIDECNNKLNK